MPDTQIDYTSPNAGEQVANQVANPAPADVTAQPSDAGAAPSLPPQVDNAAPAQDNSAPGPTTAPGQPGTEPPAAPPAPPQPTGWRGVIVGALKGLVNGGIPGAVEGAVNPKQAAQQYQNRQTIQNARAQQAQAQGQSAMQEVQFMKENHAGAMALAQLNMHHLAAQYDSHSPEFQERLLAEDAGVGKTLMDNGVPVEQHFDNEDDANKYLQTRMSSDTDSPMSYVRHSDGKGGWNIFKVPAPDKLITKPVEVTIGIGANGEPLKVNYPANTLSWGRFYAIQSASMQDQAKAQQQAIRAKGVVDAATIKAKAAALSAGNRGPLAKAADGTVFRVQVGQQLPPDAELVTGALNFNTKTAGAIQAAGETEAFATDYLKSGNYTGPGDEALLEKYFDLAKPTSGFRMSEVQLKMLKDSRSWMDTAEGQAYHATNGTWFSRKQRLEIVQTMQGLANARRSGAPAANKPNTNTPPPSGSSGKGVSLKAAMALPINKGKTEQQVRADIIANKHTVLP